MSASPMQIMSSPPPPQPQPPKLDGEPTRKRERATPERAGQLVKRRRTSEAWEGAGASEAALSLGAPGWAVRAASTPAALGAGRAAVGAAQPPGFAQWTARDAADETLIEPDDGSGRAESMVHRKHEPEEGALPAGAEQEERVKEEAQDAGMGGAGCVEDEAGRAVKREAGGAAASGPGHVPAPIEDMCVFGAQEPAPPPPRKLGMRHLPLMYEMRRDALVCRMCLSRKEQIDPALRVASFPENAAWKDLVGHCEAAHPRGYEMLLGMGSDEIEEAKIKWKR
ncbi:hypothetical protein B0H21DRAFT_729956 [Amylocystis lapponica]|nr:hypothetical protein B0H21DRAFT_729956 [Amylocystis lapponica]